MVLTDNHQLIDKYLNDSLTNEEIRIFRQQFNTNPAFAREVKQHTDMRIALITAARHRTAPQKQARILHLGYASLSIAASVVFLIGFALWYLMRNPDPYHQLYASYYVNPIENNDLPLTRSAISIADEIALSRFPEAIRLMEETRFTEAIAVLQELAQLNQNMLTDDIEWYLALAMLREGRLDEVRELLGKIFDSNSIHSQKALVIYNQL